MKLKALTEAGSYPMVKSDLVTSGDGTIRFLFFSAYRDALILKLIAS